MLGDHSAYGCRFVVGTVTVYGHSSSISNSHGGQNVSSLMIESIVYQKINNDADSTIIARALLLHVDTDSHRTTDVHANPAHKLKGFT